MSQHIEKSPLILHLERPNAQTHSSDLSEQDIQSIKKSNLDLLLHFGVGPINETLCQAVKYGIWRYRRDADGWGRVKGVWELYNGQPALESVLLTMTGTFREPVALYRSWCKTNLLSLYLTQSRLYWKSSKFIIRCLRKLAAGDREPRTDSTSTIANDTVEKNVSPPTNLQMFLLTLRIAKRGVIQLFQTLLLRSYWSVGWREIPENSISQITNDYALHDFREIPAPKDRFYADPCIVKHQGQTWVFFEDYRYKDKRGRISVMELVNGVWQNPHVVLQKDYHLSFPFVFMWQGDVYMVPESSQHRTIELYKSDTFPKEWRHVKNLFHDIIAVDTILFEHDGIWWLLSSFSEQSYDTRDDLFLFFADSPLGEWQPHPMNPVVSDIRTARNAGRIFFQDGKMIRPSQDCSISYGHGIHLNHITCLSKTEYREESIAFLEPRWRSALIGAHTFNTASGLEIIDGQRWIWKCW